MQRRSFIQAAATSVCTFPALTSSEAHAESTQESTVRYLGREEHDGRWVQRYLATSSQLHSDETWDIKITIGGWIPFESLSVEGGFAEAWLEGKDIRNLTAKMRDSKTGWIALEVYDPEGVVRTILASASAITPTREWVALTHGEHPRIRFLRMTEALWIG